MSAADVKEYLHDETAGGVALLVAAVAALVWANVAGDAYADVWHAELPYLDLQHWVNDGLMAVFFFVVGLEIRREVTDGELADPRAAALPALAAAGGVLLPALVFLAVVQGGEGAAGWAIPAATDIAFAVGVLALLGDRVPDSARIVLLSIAIVDDILAIAIIALVYSGGVDAGWLAVAAATFAVVAVAARAGIRTPLVFLPLAALAWFAVHESGVHATIAGVVLALLIPPGDLEHRLHPFSAFVVVPLFALANAGIDLGGATFTTLTWAVIAGLVLGKLLGVAGTARVVLRGGGTLPEGVRPVHLLGLGALAGIGFTVSIFIAGLAFADATLVDQAKLGILVGSVASAGLGAGLLLALKR